MLSKVERESYRRRYLEMYQQAGIALVDTEKENMEIADFGLSKFDQIGLGIIVYINTLRVCAKELAMLPGQICPEHRHPPFDDEPGKEETFRCRWGVVHLFTPDPTEDEITQNSKNGFTASNEIVLLPGDQFTVMPDTLHWFRAGPQGAIISEFSTRSRDEIDVFTDRSIRRMN